jgi:hypothetical protein
MLYSKQTMKHVAVTWNNLISNLNFLEDVQTYFLVHLWRWTILVFGVLKFLKSSNYSAKLREKRLRKGPK